LFTILPSMPPVVRMLLFHASEPTLDSCTPFRVLNCVERHNANSAADQAHYC
jgi:hypothetical protein